MPVNLNSFMAPGYPGNDMESQTFSEAAVGGDERGSQPSYKIQPVIWMWITLIAAIVGLYFFLEE